MSEAKFTKTSWLVVKEDYRTIIGSDDFLGRHIAYMSDGGVPEEEEEANAHLIAAAPELYEALEWLEVYAKVQVERFPMADDTDGWKKVLSSLAKARGENNALRIRYFCGSEPSSLRRRDGCWNQYKLIRRTV